MSQKSVGRANFGSRVSYLAGSEKSLGSEIVAKCRSNLITMKPKVKTRVEKRPSWAMKKSDCLRSHRGQGRRAVVRKGPLIDTAATAPIWAPKDAKYLTNIQPITGVTVTGIAGATKPTHTGTMSIGQYSFQKGLLLPGAKESVVPVKELTKDGSTYVQWKDGAALVKDGKATVCIPEKEQFRLPVEKVGSKVAHVELVLAEAKAKEAKRLLLKKSMLEHQLECHKPKMPDCDVCDEALAKKDTKNKSPDLGDRAPELISLGADFMGKLEEDINNHCWIFNVMDINSGIAAAESMPDKKHEAVLKALRKCINKIRRECGTEKQAIVRFHHDVDRSLLASVEAYALDQAWLITTTEGHDSDGAAKIERKQGKGQEMMRCALLDCTGGRKCYEEIGIPAYLHATDVGNHLQEAGDKSPVQKAGGRQVDILEEFHVFGSKAVVYQASARKEGAMDMPGRKAIYLGRSETVPGGCKVAFIEWNQSKSLWEIGPTTQHRKSVKVYDGEFPLLTEGVEQVKPAAKDFEDFVGKFSSTSKKKVYVVEKIAARKGTGANVQYKVHWKGYSRHSDTWEPAEHLEEYGAQQMLKEFNRKQAQSNVTARAFAVSEDYQAVIELMEKHDLPGTVQQNLDAYKREIKGALLNRSDELHGAEREHVLKTEKVIRLRMNQEHKAVSEKYPDGVQKFRCLVMGHTEPHEWMKGPTDSPTVMAGTVKQLLAMGLEGEAPEACKSTALKFPKYGITLNDAIKEQKGAKKRKSQQRAKKNAMDSQSFEVDVISTGDIEMAFTQSDDYGPDDRPRFVGYRAHKGAKLRVFRLRSCLYGQADAPIRYYESFRKHMETMGFERSENDKAVFVHVDRCFRVGAHVDDLITRGSQADTEWFWGTIAERFDIKTWGYLMPGEPREYCGLRLQCKVQDGIAWYGFDQSCEIREFLIEHGFEAARPVSAPMPDDRELYSDNRGVTPKEHGWIRSVVGSLQWFEIMSRYDMAYEVNKISQTLANPTQGTIKAINRIMAWLAGDWDREFWCPRVSGNTWHLYVDSDHAGDRYKDTRSRTGVFFVLNGLPVHWRSTKQPYTATSSAAAEIIALEQAVRDAMLRWYISRDIKVKVDWPVVIMVDNQTGVIFQNKPNSRTKLAGVFDLKDKWVKELQDQTKVKAVKIGTADNLSDMMTKGLSASIRVRLYTLLQQIIVALASAQIASKC